MRLYAGPSKQFIAPANQDGIASRFNDALFQYFRANLHRMGYGPRLQLDTNQWQDDHKESQDCVEHGYNFWFRLPQAAIISGAVEFKN